VSLLQQIGTWYKSVKESLVDVEPASLTTRNPNVLLTQREETLYVHLYKEQTSSAVYLHPLATLPHRATLLNTGERVECDVPQLPSLWREHPNRCLRLKNLPVDSMPGLVVKLEFDGFQTAQNGKSSVGTA
jgi:hypothetical protein